ncbi:MAG: Regulatory protein ada [Candidatus Moranbacteria bacterium GW2011_GWD2_36_198]|nr:MAG: Regulatory protein ada [Candidatus Moranbacteria bacterium GW2011_GWD2_36_198]
MRNYSKTGGKVGKPGYRTSSMFINKVFAQVKKIPKGKTLTYKEVANLVGSPNAYRAVGSALNKNVPCHRVIRSDGKIGGYNKGTKNKEKILKKEGAI